jgi:hypothetical protein
MPMRRRGSRFGGMHIAIGAREVSAVELVEGVDLNGSRSSSG